MTRENLISAVRSAAEELGYTPYFGEKAACAAKTCSFPVALVESPKVIGSEGFRDCSVVYRLTVKLLMLNNAMGISPEPYWQILERDALDFFRRIGQNDNVQRVSDFRSTPSGGSLTHMGDMSVTIEMNVEMFYCV